MYDLQVLQHIHFFADSVRFQNMIQVSPRATASIPEDAFYPKIRAGND
jgi:hypothetical protein